MKKQTQGKGDKSPKMKYLLFLSMISLPAFSSNSVVGTWKHSETHTPWMETNPQTFVSSIEISKKNGRYYAKINIEGDQSCSTQGYAKIKGNQVFLDTSFKENKDLLDFTNAEKDKPCIVTITKHADSLKIDSASPGCSSECGASASLTVPYKFKK